MTDFLRDAMERDLPPERLIEHVSAAFGALYDRHGILEIARIELRALILRGASAQP